MYAIDPDYCTGLCESEGDYWYEFDTNTCAPNVDLPAVCAGTCSGGWYIIDGNCYGEANQEPTGQQCDLKLVEHTEDVKDYECAWKEPEQIALLVTPTMNIASINLTPYFYSMSAYLNADLGPPLPGEICMCAPTDTGDTEPVGVVTCDMKDCPNGFPP